MREYRNYGLQCRARECKKPAFAKQLCRMHYGRFYKYQSLDLPPRLSVSELLLSKRRIDQRGCWIWTGSKNASGYGQIYPSGWARKPHAVHRVSYSEFKGPIPKGVFVLHRCDVKVCFNPNHLFLGDDAINMRDCAQKNRIAFGNRQPRAVLNPTIVRQIRRIYASRGISQSQLAKRYKCSQGTIWNVIQKKTWRRVTL